MAIGTDARLGVGTALAPGQSAHQRARMQAWALTVLHVRLHHGVRKPTADEALRVEDGVDRVHRRLVLGGVADHALSLRERDVRRRRAVALVVGNNLDAVVLPDANARVRGAEIDADRRALNLLIILAHDCCV